MNESIDRFFRVFFQKITAKNVIQNESDEWDDSCLQ